MKGPFILGLVGRSDVGKTTLILKLIPEILKRGYRVGVAKNCPHGFDIDREGKDSWRFYHQGSEGVFLTSPARVALIRKRKEEVENNILEMLSLFFYDFDIILAEGFGECQKMKKIELLRSGISNQRDLSLSEVIAVVSDLDIKTDKPVFKPDKIKQIVNFLEKVMKGKNQKTSVELFINGEKVFLNNFVQQMIKNLIFAIVESLKRKNEPEDIKEVVIKLEDTKV